MPLQYSPFIQIKYIERFQTQTIIDELNDIVDENYNKNIKNHIKNHNNNNIPFLDYFYNLLTDFLDKDINYIKKYIDYIDELKKALDEYETEYKLNGYDSEKKKYDKIKKIRNGLKKFYERGPSQTALTVKVQETNYFNELVGIYEDNEPYDMFFLNVIKSDFEKHFLKLYYDVNIKKSIQLIKQDNILNFIRTKIIDEHANKITKWSSASKNMLDTIKRYVEEKSKIETNIERVNRHEENIKTYISSSEQKLTELNNLFDSIKIKKPNDNTIENASKIVVFILQKTQDVISIVSLLKTNSDYKNYINHTTLDIYKTEINQIHDDAFKENENIKKFVKDYETSISNETKTINHLQLAEEALKEIPLASSYIDGENILLAVKIHSDNAIKTANLIKMDTDSGKTKEDYIRKANDIKTEGDKALANFSKKKSPSNNVPVPFEKPNNENPATIDGDDGDGDDGDGDADDGTATGDGDADDDSAGVANNAGGATADDGDGDADDDAAGVANNGDGDAGDAGDATGDATGAVNNAGGATGVVNGDAGSLNKKNNTGIIIGASVGGIVFISIIVYVIFKFKVKKHRINNKNNKNNKKLKK